MAPKCDVKPRLFGRRWMFSPINDSGSASTSAESLHIAAAIQLPDSVPIKAIMLAFGAHQTALHFDFFDGHARLNFFFADQGGPVADDLRSFRSAASESGYSGRAAGNQGNDLHPQSI